jgi:DNA replication and repair protein RecF
MMVHLKHLSLKNFRCFTQKNVDFLGPLVLIDGLNGAGKTSLLEAIHYLGYLRSFRTHSLRELLQIGQESFFIKATISTVSEGDCEIQIGCSGTKRLVKINQKAVSSYKELMNYFRIVTITEDDMGIIKEGPEMRRSFMDQTISLSDFDFIAKLRSVRTIADNRNRLLQKGSTDRHMMEVFTHQLFDASQIVQHRRIDALQVLEEEVRKIVAEYFDDQFNISIAYAPKNMSADMPFDVFLAQHESLYGSEYRYGRSLFGAHLDDIAINFEHKKSKAFASRGQQKLVVLLIKIAHMRQLIAHKEGAVFLLDDFMTDFDEQRADRALDALVALNCQLIFTAPARIGGLEQNLLGRGAQKLLLTR